MKSTGRFTTELRRLMADSYDVCRSCGSRLETDVAAYAGYASDGTPLFVGNCCKSLLSELATHVYWWWEADKRCAPDTVLWRFMDFAKFTALLDQRAIYFARADKLGDRYEGAAGITGRQLIWDTFYLDFFRQAIKTAPGQTKQPTDQHIERKAARLLADFTAASERDRLCSFVSCWHSNNVESEALWRLYCPPSSSGVAIRTDAGSLMRSLDDDPKIRIGRVQYVDFRKGYAGLHDRVFWKRMSLSHEAEVRAVIKEPQPQDQSGLLIPVDLTQLFLAIVPSPFASPWFPDILKATMRRFDVDAPIVSSELLSEPFF